MLKDPTVDVLFKNKALFMRSELAVQQQQQQDIFKAEKIRIGSRLDRMTHRILAGNQ